MHFDDDDIPCPRSGSGGASFQEVVGARLSRRGFLKGLASAGALSLWPGWGSAEAATAGASTLTFQELSHGLDETLHVAPGHTSQVLIRWGDPVTADAPAFNPASQSAAGQGAQFGFNNDHIAYIPLDPHGEDASRHGLLAVNHEYTDPRMMFPGSPSFDKLSDEQTEITILAMGLSIIEVRRTAKGWVVVEGSQYARRITPHTEMVLCGPAAGHARMVTSGSPGGRRAYGTFGNCAGGITPWGTVLTAEENIQYYFQGDAAAGAEAVANQRMGLGRVRPSMAAGWGRLHARFDLDKEPRAANHVGWIVEFDPRDPKSRPRKRTALGRFKHEGCGTFVNGDGRVVAYMGDDQYFEYVYRFVSAGRYHPNHRSANHDLLDKGTLSVARFEDDGKVRWLPLVYGQGPLTPANGFKSQADVLIETRRAADLVGATKMDRPEDVEVNPRTGTVFVMLTKNHKRQTPNPANPRVGNNYGQIVELSAPGGDHSADTFTWDFLLLAGDPAEKEHGARYHEAVSRDGWFMAPDNCTFDNAGRLWISTDGSYRYGFADGLWACDVVGPGRALTRHFLRTPREAELTGPCFTPDNTTLFCSVQHPGERSSFDEPSTRWPDFDPKMPPRPSVVAVTRDDGGEIG